MAGEEGTMTFLNNDGEYELGAKTQANRDARCLCCDGPFKQDAGRGVYGLTFCGACLDFAIAGKGKMPPINYPMNKLEEEDEA